MNVLIHTFKPVNYAEIAAAIAAGDITRKPELLAEMKRALEDHQAVFRAAEEQIKKQTREAQGLFAAFEKCDPLFKIQPDAPPSPGDDADNEKPGDQNGKPTNKDSGQSPERKPPVRNKAVKPSKTIEHSLSASQKTCSCCGKNMHQSHDKIVTIIRLTGFSKERHVIETGRCLTCDTKAVAQFSPEKTICSFTIPAASLITSLRYAYGLPSFRIEEVSASMGYRIPDSTQWDIFETVGNQLLKFHKFLKAQAAQTKIALMDDTSVRINSLTSMFKKGTSGTLEILPEGRTGVHTTGFLALFPLGKICLFQSGLHHAGEFFEKLMASRSLEEEVLLMMDASSSNTCKLKGMKNEVVQANCNSHSVRKFKEVGDNPVFSEDASVILELYAKIYARNAELAKETPERRQAVHKSESLPEMERIKKKIEDDFAALKVEPASALGGHYKYFIKHFEKLCAFCHHPGAPICNNACERILKRAIRHRKNSLFFKNLVGAAVGDIIMSILITAKENGIEPVKYLSDLLGNLKHVDKNPDAWLPWNYLQTLEVVAMGPPEPD